MTRGPVTEDDVERALNANRAIIHIMGDHSGDDADGIIAYKTKDVTERGAKFTLWAQHSPRAKPDTVRAFCSTGEDVYLYLIGNLSPRRKYSGAPTSAAHVPATEFCDGDRLTGKWQSIPSLGIQDVKDNATTLRKANGRALVLGRLHLLPDRPRIHFGDWAEQTPDGPRVVRTYQGNHVLCAERRDMRGHQQMKSCERAIVAVARLVKPYAVWLRTIS